MDLESDLESFSLASFSLAGRTAVVTGGNTGLGQAFTVALAAAGADVFVPTVLDDGGETRELVAKRGARMHQMVVDLVEPGAPRRVVAECRDTLRQRRRPGQLRGHPALSPRSRTSAGRSGTRWSPQPHGRLRAGPRGSGADEGAGWRQDHQHRVAVLVPGRSAAPRRTPPRSTGSSASPRPTPTSSASTASRSTRSSHVYSLYSVCIARTDSRMSSSQTATTGTYNSDIK